MNKRASAHSIAATAKRPLWGRRTSACPGVSAEADVREDLHSVRKVVTAANNIRLDADRDERGHADRFWALALAHHAADDFKKPLPAPIARKPMGW